MSQTTVDQSEEADSDASPQTSQAEPPACEDETMAGLFGDFTTLEQLARAQNVQPMTDVESLFGAWPGDEDDGFEAAVDELRHPARFRPSPGSE
ncbi:MAG: hypothetical protein OXO48_05450 [Caldilineaceae bacterium]|nr:hypothetical protein [Caldilineaceae bacterium]